MSYMLQPTILLLREGTDTSQGRGQIISNIDACLSIVDTVRTTLGPRGMDKLIHDGKKATISNDGATIMKLLDVVHPAAKILVDIAKSQDAEVGDGTTTVVVLAGEILRQAKQFIEAGVHSQVIIRAYRQASTLAIKRLLELAVHIGGKDDVERRSLLQKCAGTALNSKLIGGQNKEFFSKMCVDAVMHLDEDLDLDLIGIKKVPGGTMQDSFLVEGVAFKKTFSYAGFEQQPKKFENPKILLLNVELELKAEKENAEVRLSDPSQYQSIVDAEWNIIYDKLEKIVATGAKIILSKLAIGDLATQYFADRDVFCAGRVPEEDLRRVAKATGGQVQTSTNDFIPEILGTCGFFEERQVGAERYNIFTGCPQARTATIILRGGTEQFIEEADRSLHDAIMIVKRALKNANVVAGGGAIEMELSRYLRDHARQIQGKSQLIINAYAKALEIIPRQIAENAGFDATDLLNKLRQRHAQPDGTWFGIDINNEDIGNTLDSFVWEPSLIKQNAIAAATEAACLILSIDETVTNPQSEKPQNTPLPRGGGRGRGGMGGMAGMAGLGRGVRKIQGRGGK